MPRHTLTASAHMEHPPAAIYRVLSDYRQHHPAILPPAFRNFVVHQGGVGLGTTFTFDLKVLGGTRHYAGEVTEARPDSYLAEAYPAEGSLTWFRIEPAPGGCIVTIGTEFNSRSGLAGVVERFMAEWVLRPIYADELKRLNEYCQRL